MARSVLGLSGGARTTPVEPRTALRSQSAQTQLRRRRSQGYVEALHRLDAGGTVCSADTLNALREIISAEFPDGPGTWPVGWVSKCYLGPPFEVHTLDFTGEIVRHFKRGEPMPDGLERARRLAASGQYALIEVFSNQLVAISPDGSTSVLTV